MNPPESSGAVLEGEGLNRPSKKTLALTTKRCSLVPPAFPMKMPELGWKVSGSGLLRKETRWCSSQSM